jgi:asparagine synthase (glutamine-hydrolysing)
MGARLAHRGPDGDGLRAFPGCAMAHRRLAIIDLSARGAQPMANEDESVWIVFNGEILNHVELRRELEARHEFRSRSDTEVILHLYEEKGVEAVHDLRGFFAFAIWDRRERRLLLAPYLMLGYVPAPATPLEGIRRLPAGSLLTYESGRLRVERYWSPPLPVADPAARPGAEEPRDAWRAFPSLLEESVRLRLRSDVPLGVFLSGGLDSAVVAAHAARLSSERIRTFTVVFDEAGYDESAAARETATAIGSEHHEIRVESRVAETLPSMIRLMGEPFADSSLIPVHRLSAAVRKEVKVALSGDGGGEVFLGYDRYRAHRLAERWRRLPAAARGAARAAVSAIPGARGRRNLAGRAGRFVEAAAQDPLAANDRWISRFSPSALEGILSPEALAGTGPDPLGPVHDLYREASSAPALDAISRADLMLWLPEDVLRKVDGASMACGLEVRSPLLDQKVVERAAALPAAVRMPKARGKEILKSCARRILPRAVTRRRKAGFGLPVDRWLRRPPLRDLARDTLASSSARTRDLLVAGKVRELLGEHERGEANHDEAIWTLMVLEIFLREIVEAG